VGDDGDGDGDGKRGEIHRRVSLLLSLSLSLHLPSFSTASTFQEKKKQRKKNSPIGVVKNIPLLHRQRLLHPLHSQEPIRMNRLSERKSVVIDAGDGSSSCFDGCDGSERGSVREDVDGLFDFLELGTTEGGGERERERVEGREGRVSGEERREDRRGKRKQKRMAGRAGDHLKKRRVWKGMRVDLLL